MPGLPNVGQAANSLLGQSTVLNQTTHKPPLVSQTQLFDALQTTYPLDQLLELQWAGIGAPVQNLHTTISHDVVEHKFPFVDGAKLEETGRNPTVVSGTVLFFNTIAPNANTESWTKGDLYQNQYSKFLSACYDGKTHTLQHPVLGNMKAKCISATTNLIANVRGGEAVDVVWKETISSSDQTTSNLTFSITKLNAQSQQLDNSINSLLNPNPHTLFPQYFNQQVNFGNMALEILSLLTQTQFFSEQAVSLMNQIEFFTLNIIQSCKDFDNVTVAAIQTAAFNLYSTAVIIKNDATILQTYQFVPVKLTYTTKQPMTFTQLARLLSNSVTQLMKLNPSLISKPIIPANTHVKYFIQESAGLSTTQSTANAILTK